MSEVSQVASFVSQLRTALGSVIRGKPDAIELLLIGLFAGGHVLLEDVPGVGKTTLAKALARAVRFDFARVQLTPDLLPSDIIGTNVLRPQDGTIGFTKGPVFTNLLLADELNRASPRTQSALLEAMSERQVTIDGKTTPLPPPFMVIATQNPQDFQGTFPLPEAQLDRFMLRVSIGYPSLEDEVEVLFDRRTEDPLEAITPIAHREDIESMQRVVTTVEVKPSVARYIVALCRATRSHDDIALGASPRASLVLFRTSQARAFLKGRSYVLPDDIRGLFVPVLGHRIKLTERARYGGQDAAATLADVMIRVPVPT